MKVLSDERHKRLLECEQIAQRFCEARRWFSEFDYIFQPLFDYVNGEMVTHTSEYGQIWVMKNGNMSNVRDLVRDEMKKFKGECQQNESIAK